MSDLDDDDEIFYGGGKAVDEGEKKQAKKQDSKKTSYSHDYVKPPEDSEEGVEPAPEEEIPKTEADIEAEISHTRQEKRRAADYHDVTILREKAAKHSAEAAKLFNKYRSEEAAMVKYQELANKARRKAEGYIEKGKNAMAKADEKQMDLQYVEGGKAERTRVKVAKLKAKAAKMKSKSSSWQSKSAKATQKAAAKREKAKALLEQSKTHEAEALNYNKRADNLLKVQNA